MAHAIMGAATMAGFFMLVNYAQKKGLMLNWWKWLLTVLGFLYAFFVLEVIYGFFEEGFPQAALIMGLATGIVAIIWGVLLKRFVFKPAS